MSTKLYIEVSCDSASHDIFIPKSIMVPVQNLNFIYSGDDSEGKYDIKIDKISGGWEIKDGKHYCPWCK